jgi:S1-C subfamily serine protease
MAVGNHDGRPLAALGIVAIAGWLGTAFAAGTIDSLIRLDLALNPAAEGGALVDLQGRVIGMTVLGPRRRALSIPSSTINSAVDGQRAMRAAQAFEAGNVWINAWGAVSSMAYKNSGYGREMGFAVMRELTQQKSVWVNVR